MSSPRISVIVPTIEGREAHYERCRAAYQEHTAASFEILTVRYMDCCGKAWNAGARRARGEFLHFTADDLAPVAGWDTIALETVAEGYLPAPVVYGLDHRIESSGGHWARWLADREITLNTCVIPFFPRADWARIGPIIETHYYTDNYFSDRARAAGAQFAVRHGYAFMHHWAKEGRGDEQARLASDSIVYEKTRRIPS